MNIFREIPPGCSRIHDKWVEKQYIHNFIPFLKEHTKVVYIIGIHTLGWFSL